MYVFTPGKRRTAAVRVVTTVAAAGALLSGCSVAPAQNAAPEAAPTGVSGELTIYAAASLAASFTELAEVFAADHPGVVVNPISFDGSSTLATQVFEGAPADVFASANEANMQKVAELVDGEPAMFVSNVLQIAVEPGNPKKIGELADLSASGLRVVLCAPKVPCGTASHALLDADSILLTPASEEQNVKAVLTKVQLGEADAGLVYVTDVTASGGAVEGVAIDGADRAKNDYPIAALQSSKNPEAARAFIEFVLSERGQDVLARYGFSAP